MRFKNVPPFQPGDRVWFNHNRNNTPDVVIRCYIDPRRDGEDIWRFDYLLGNQTGRVIDNEPCYLYLKVGSDENSNGV